MFGRILALAAASVLALPAWGASYYTTRLDDAQAAYLTPANFPVKGDGIADDSDALQQAINHVQETRKSGIVFVPEGRYRITKTIYIWPSIRVIGYGKTRPVLVLGAHTAGYDDPKNEKYMVFFAGRRPLPPGSHAPDGFPGMNDNSGVPPDANAGTFFSAMSNIDIEIGDGNPGAVGVRGKYAQHSYLAHIDFHIGSGLAGLREAGNAAEDLRFFGGKYGIWTSTPSPSWQFTAVDAYFEGQSVAAIRDHAAGLTLVRPHFVHMPTAVEMEEGSTDDLWIKDGRMEDISAQAILISVEGRPRNELNMENVVCSHVPEFARFRSSGKALAAPGDIYSVKTFAYGLHFAEIGAVGKIRTQFDAAALQAMPAPVPSDLTPLPPAETWANVRQFGARGDGETDDTEAIRKAIASSRAIYFPSGVYILSDTVELKPDTVLIGLHSSDTMLKLKDRTPAFQGLGNPKPMIVAPRGGTNIMIGLGVYTNGINPRAVSVQWMAGTGSLMDDVRFHGGHGTPAAPGATMASWGGIYNNTHTADPDSERRWDAQYPSLWITNGGGGTFIDIWTPSTFANAGVLISDTDTPGRIYEMSSEHHQRYEMLIRNASNWQIFAMQTEEERGEGPVCSSVELQNASNILFTNFHMYRVISSYNPFPYGIKITDSKNIRFRNMHAYSNSRVAFDATIWDSTHDVRVGEKEFAWLDVTGNPPAAKAASSSPVLAPGARVVKLAGGFFNISGGVAAPSGDFYFADPYRERIYKWSAAGREVSVVRDNTLEPVNLALDKAGNLLVVSTFGDNAVYTFNPEKPGLGVEVLKAEPVQDRTGKTLFLPDGDWSLKDDSDASSSLAQIEHPTGQYVSPDGSTVIVADKNFVTGARSWGVKSSPAIRFGLQPVRAGQKAYFTDESGVATYEGVVQPDGSLSGVRLFVNQGGEGVAADARGNVYIANGRIFVYSPKGDLLDAIDVPERPIQLVFGGKDGKTLFIAARSGLYSVQTR